MKTPVAVLLAACIGLSCGPRENDVRAIVRDELSRAGKKLIISNAEVIGPYSPAVRVGNFLFISGQIGLVPETGSLAGPTIEDQTKQALKNMHSVLVNAGYDSSHVVQCTVFLKDINDFQRMNLIYGGYFQDGSYPARTTVEVSNLPRNAIVEIASIAYKNTEP